MIILIDNYDSFTYNLVHYFQEIGEKVKVYRNDEKESEYLINNNHLFLFWKFSLLTNHSQGDLNPKIWEVFAILG